MPYASQPPNSPLLVPDVVHRPSAALRQAAIGRGPAARAPMQASALDPAMRQIRMSLKDVLVIDNRDIGRGDIYVVTVVADDIGPEPIAMTARTFQDIRKGQRLTLGPSGIAMYRHGLPLPAYLDYRILVAESDQGLRDAGALLQQVRADATFVSFRDSLIKVAATGAPAAALATAAADFTLQLVGRILASNRDDQLMYVAGSFDDAFDNPACRKARSPTATSTRRSSTRWKPPAERARRRALSAARVEAQVPADRSTSPAARILRRPGRAASGWSTPSTATGSRRTRS